MICYARTWSIHTSRSPLRPARSLSLAAVMSCALRDWGLIGPWVQEPLCSTCTYLFSWLCFLLYLSGDRNVISRGQEIQNRKSIPLAVGNDMDINQCLLIHVQVHLKKLEYHEKGQYFLSLISESETHILYRFITHRVKYFKPFISWFFFLWLTDNENPKFSVSENLTIT